MAPEAGVTIAPLTNGSGSRRLYAALCRELLGELAEVRLHLVYAFVDGMKELSPPIEADLVPVSQTASETVFAARGSCCYVGMRAAPKVR